MLKMNRKLKQRDLHQRKANFKKKKRMKILHSLLLKKKKPIMGKFDKYEDSSDSEAFSAAIRATLKIGKHVSKYRC
jgi:hypothetical protein